jgi:DNA-directed RNA polymerase I, II, and III subunit RPABC1
MKIIFKRNMSNIIMSVNIELNNREINNIVCLNVLKMLHRRNLIDDVDVTYTEIGDDINEKANIQFKLNDDSKCSIYTINTKLNSIAQGTPIDEYLSNNVTIHKIVILKDAAKKVLKQIQTEYKNAEFFFEHEMLEDIPSKIFIPKHQLLNEEEKTKLLLKFNENELSNILDVDMMARYYNAKFGDIFKIIRPSVVSGNSIFYRKVIHGSLDLLYS